MAPARPDPTDETTAETTAEATHEASEDDDALAREWERTLLDESDDDPDADAIDFDLDVGSDDLDFEE